MKTRSNADAKQAKGKRAERVPGWWSDSEDPDWKTNRPKKYVEALYYLCDQLGIALFEGRYGELLRNGAIIEAFEVVANPQSAGTDAAAVAEMTAEVTEETEKIRANYDSLSHKLETGDLLKGLFSGGYCFVNDDMAISRRYFLRRPHAANNLERILKSEKVDAGTVAAFLKTQTLDDCELKDPVSIRINWLNSKFAFFADCHLSQWLDYVELPKTFATEKLRAEIEENFGLFPLPFKYGVNYHAPFKQCFDIEVSESLLSLVRLLKIEAKRQSATAYGMSQVAFARECHVSVKTVQKWDKGRISPRGLKYIPRIWEKDATAAATFAIRYKSRKGGIAGAASEAIKRAEENYHKKMMDDIAASLGDKE